MGQHQVASLTESPSIRDEDGYLFPMIRKNENYPGRALEEQAWKIEDIEREFRAQIELAKKHIPRLSHVSCHMGCDKISEETERLVKRLAKEYEIDIDLDALDIQRARMKGQRGDRKR